MTTLLIIIGIVIATFIGMAAGAHYIILTIERNEERCLLDDDMREDAP